jgi:hypothetical protein
MAKSSSHIAQAAIVGACFVMVLNCRVSAQQPRVAYPIQSQNKAPSKGNA